MSTFVLDPKGYFLIRINHDSKQIDIAFLEYTDQQLKGSFSSNEIKEQFSSKDFNELLFWCKKRISREDHLDYVKQELKKALLAQEQGLEYVQS